VKGNEGLAQVSRGPDAEIDELRTPHVHLMWNQAGLVLALIASSWKP